jgi:hypothetical protein
MACTATISSIDLIPDGTGTGINYGIIVLFNDTVSGFTQTKNYSFPVTETIAAARATIQSDLNGFKTLIAEASSLQQYIGTVLS